jgi:hypothetical protein
MAPSSSSSPPSKKTKCAKKKKTSLTIKKDGIICWDGFTMLTALKDESPANLNDVLTEMGVKHLSHDEQTALIRNYNNCVGKLNLKNDPTSPKLQDVCFGKANLLFPMMTQVLLNQTIRFTVTTRCCFFTISKTSFIR